jgi:ATP-dependent DNA ligase
MLWTAPTLRMLYAFDLLELDGEDLRPEPIEKRKDLLAELLRGPHSSISRRTARLYSVRLASSVARVSYRNGSARPIARGVRRIG